MANTPCRNPALCGVQNHREGTLARCLQGSTSKAVGGLKSAPAPKLATSGSSGGISSRRKTASGNPALHRAAEEVRPYIDSFKDSDVAHNLDDLRLTRYDPPTLVGWAREPFTQDGLEFAAKEGVRVELHRSDDGFTPRFVKFD